MTRTMRTLARPPRRALVWLAVGGGIAASLGVLQLAGGAAAQEAGSTATATRGDLVVQVGGVGRVVQGAQTSQFFPLASGQVVSILVKPGQRVAAGQAIASLDDGGVAAASLRLAESDLAVARLELQQRQMSRSSDLSAARAEVERANADFETLLGGSARSRVAAVRIARLTVQLAQARLARVLAPASEADVQAAQADLKQARAALAVLRKPPPAPLPEAIAAAQQAVAAARANLAQAKLTGTAADVEAAKLELARALAELASLQQQPAAPLPEEIEAAQAAVDSAQLKLDRLLAPPNPADVKSARLELASANADLRTLLAGATPLLRASALQAVRSARAKLALTARPIDLALAREKVLAADSALAGARATERQLTVRAPVAATVTSLLVGPGAQVDRTTPIVAVADLDRLSVSVDLSEFDVAQVKPGQKAAVSIDALGGEAFSGRVTFVAPVGNDTNGVVTFPVEIAFAPSGAVKPGMNASVRIVVAKAEDVVQVPVEAVSQNDEDQSYVMVVDESGQETTRKVTVGLENNDKVEIVKGLEAGEVVVLPDTQAAEEE